MVVYVDILIIINTVLNYAVLMTADKLLKRDIRLWRLILGAFAGAFFSLTMFLEINSRLILLAVKLISSAVITIIAFGFKSRREFFKALTMTAAVSLIYSGGIILFCQIFKPPSMLIINDVPYLELDPLILIALTAAIYLILLLINKLFSERIKNTVVSLRFTVSDKEYSCIGKPDTGCNLVEPFSSSPVIIVDRKIFSADDADNRRIIPYATVGGSSFLFAVKADSVSIDKQNIEKSVYIASADIKNCQYEAVINYEIIR